MSRIGKNPIPVASGINVTIDGGKIVVKGPKGELERVVHSKVSVKLEDNNIVVERGDDDRESRALHGLTRALVSNMVEGVSKGFTKVLQVKGTGYKFESKGQKIGFSLGFSHPCEMEIPKGISAEIKPDELTLTSCDKELLGDFAAKIKALRPVEPYKGKGVFYKGQVIKRKAGKAAGK